MSYIVVQPATECCLSNIAVQLAIECNLSNIDIQLAMYGILCYISLAECKSPEPFLVMWQVIECLPIKCNRAIRRGGGWRDVVRKSGRSERGPT